MTGNDQLNDQDRWLAAEYALGVLDRNAMAAAELRCERDAAFRQAVESWHDQLSSLLHEVDDVSPSGKVWKAIEAEIAPPARAEASSGGNAGVWKFLAALTSTIAVASFAMLVYVSDGTFMRQTEAPKSLVATLTKSGEVPAFVAQFDPAGRSLVVRAAVDDGSEKVPELWLIPNTGVKKGQAISLGLVNEAAPERLVLTDENLALMTEGGTLAITMEPPGGAPGGVATGEVIALGILQSF